MKEKSKIWKQTISVDLEHLNWDLKRVGKIKEIRKVSQPWKGFIGPDHIDARFAFDLQKNKRVDFNNFEREYSYDLVRYLHDKKRLIALNVKSLEKIDLSKVSVFI